MNTEDSMWDAAPWAVIWIVMTCLVGWGMCKDLQNMDRSPTPDCSSVKFVPNPDDALNIEQLTIRYGYGAYLLKEHQ